MRTLTIGDKTLPIPESFTLGELRTLKHVSGLGNLTQVFEGLAEGDPDAIVALILVSWRRADPGVTEATIDALSLDTVIVGEVPEIPLPSRAAADPGAAPSPAMTLASSGNHG